MKLFIDVGNSRLKWAVRADGKWVAEGSAPATVDRLPDWRDLPAPDAAWIAGVNKEEFLQHVADACIRSFGIRPVRLRTQAETCGVRCAYADPARLGVDRWLAAIAAFRQAAGPVVVFDCGTAITVDAVTGGGEHLGGLIVPGFDLMRRALYGSTAGIPDESSQDDGSDVALFARDTRTAVRDGSLRAVAAFLRHVAAESRGPLGAERRILLTGGDSERLIHLLPPEFEWRPRLVMEGMLAMSRCEEQE